MATIYTTADIAAKFDTTPRTLRKFLRSADGTDSQVGKGKRWGIEGKQVRSLQARFKKWEAAQEEDRAARAAAKLEAADDAELVDEVEVTDEVTED